MLTILRQEEIMAILQAKKSATVKQLEEALYASGSTIRRDLTELEKLGLIRRSHGGAVLVERTGDESSPLLREQQNPRQKRQAAEAAVSLIQSGMTLFLDSSSSSGMLIPLLGRLSDLTVITNGLKNALLLSEKTSVRVVMAGGTVKSGSGSVVGSEAYASLERLHPDLAVFSCSGVDRQGMTETSLEQCSLKQLMLRNSAASLLLCDDSKFGRTYLARLGDFSGLRYLAANLAPDEEIRQAMEAEGCTLVLPPRPKEELLSREETVKK